jgi:predicted outer membrane repeat protein
MNSFFPLFISCLLGWPASVHAGVVYVNSTSTADICGDTPERGCQNILKAITQAANYDTILLVPGIYSRNGNEGITNVYANGTIKINKVGLIIAGQSFSEPSIIHCVERNRFLFSEFNFVIGLNNLTIENCVTPLTNGLVDLVGGAVIFIQTAATLQQVTFQHNRADMGGAIGASNSNISVVDCTFIKNNATVFGGAVATEGSSINITKSDFIMNRASGKSALLSVTVDVVGRGGAVFVSTGGAVRVSRSYFESNQALISGGGIHIQYMDSALVDTVTFKLNSVSGSEDCVSDTSCNIRGGAIFVNDVNFELVGSTFSNNSVSTSTLNQVSFEKNKIRHTL